MREFIMQYWVEAVFGMFCTGLGWACKYLYTRLTATERGIQALLREQIVRSYYHYHERGWITLHGLESIERMYDGYHNLGGNGTVTKLLEDLRELPVKDTVSVLRKEETNGDKLEGAD